MVLFFTRQGGRGREVNEFGELWCLNPINLTKLNCLLLAVLRQSFLFFTHSMMLWWAAHERWGKKQKKWVSIINISFEVSVELIKFVHLETRWWCARWHRRFIKNHLRMAVQDESDSADWEFGNHLRKLKRLCKKNGICRWSGKIEEIFRILLKIKLFTIE